MSPLDATLLVHAAATLFMTGVIWFVQLVHYPLFAGVDAASFCAYEREHQRRTTWVVAPAMLVELATAAAIVALRPTWTLAWLGVALVALLWALTAFVQVPCHQRLESAFAASAHARLVRTNWLRTIAWSARGVIALLMLIG